MPSALRRVCESLPHTCFCPVGGFAFCWRSVEAGTWQRVVCGMQRLTTPIEFSSLRGKVSVVWFLNVAAFSSSPLLRFRKTLPDPVRFSQSANETRAPRHGNALYYHPLPHKCTGLQHYKFLVSPFDSKGSAGIWPFLRLACHLIIETFPRCLISLVLHSVAMNEITSLCHSLHASCHVSLTVNVSA